jgi:hypothetical protein
MPWSALRKCAHPGCEELVHKGRCKKHSSRSFRDAHIPERQRLYNDPRWKKIRAAQLAKEPWCARHLEQGYYVAATDVDHKERHEGDLTKFFEGPFESLCHSCHSRKTSVEVGWTPPG